ncbi:mitochondrial mRNA pseudouridine synthase RPUSD3 isoform X3 [Microtus oregoni]|uniref:mitochondrial mRNA pseudouridine synthase RPUSD3 isoform X3 n=1 Tax=Microtus oregoni TaxID=111838 RepID=UPI001BB1E6F3|nr:mitochondrial mRNA pseudouridine synthase RPUSD3 isoform X3 [Microtus oregoni]
MGALRVWRWISETWRPGFGAGVRRRDAGFGTEARRRPQPQASSKSKDPVEDQPFPGLLRTENLGVEELVDVLKAAVVDQKGPLVTLSKPQGLPVTGRPGELTLLSVLPQLSQALGLGHQELQIVRAPGKEASGLVLLSGCPQTASRLQKFFAHSRRSQRPTATYCAITDGIPEPSEGTVSVALRLERVDGIDLAVPVASPSRKDILEGVKRTFSHFHVMATGCGCALVQLQPLTGRGHLRFIGSGNEDSPSWSGRTAGSSPIFQCFPVNCRCTWLCSSARCLGTTPMLLEWALFWASAFCGQPRPPNPRHRSWMKLSSNASA